MSKIIPKGIIVGLTKSSSTAFARLIAEHENVEVWFEPMRDRIINARFEGGSAENQWSSHFFTSEPKLGTSSAMIAKENLGIGSLETAQAPIILSNDYGRIAAITFLFPEPRRWLHSLIGLAKVASTDESRAAAGRLYNCVHAWRYLEFLVQSAQGQSVNVSVVTQRRLSADPLGAANWLLNSLGLNDLKGPLATWSFSLLKHPRIIAGHQIADRTFDSNFNSKGPDFVDTDSNANWPAELPTGDAEELSERYSALCERYPAQPLCTETNP